MDKGLTNKIININKNISEPIVKNNLCNILKIALLSVVIIFRKITIYHSGITTLDTSCKSTVLEAKSAIFSINIFLSTAFDCT